MHELIVLSDLHMGRGINPETRRYYTLENFFFDEDFARLCAFLCRDAKSRKTSFKLIFNGDTFDLLRIDPPASSVQAKRQSPPSSAQFRRVHNEHSPSQAAQTLKEILAGHLGFVRGLAQVLHEGYEIVFLPGNHDIEMQWAQVQNEVRHSLIEHVSLSYGEEAKDAADKLLQFAPWFYHEPNRVWIEHGCQYDPENSFRYLLRTELDSCQEDVPNITAHDMPLGNFFQRYLYNAFGHITFIVPSTRANLRYVRWLLLHAPRLLFHVMFSHGPFVFQVIRRLGQSAHSQIKRRLEKMHTQALSALAHSSGLGPKLLAIDQLKEVRADAVQAMQSLSWQGLKLLMGTLLFAGASAGLWFFGAYFITEMTLGAGPKAVLFLFLTLVLTLVSAGVVLYSTFGGATDISPRPLRRAAQRIAAIADVPVVSFGHSHDEEVWRLERPNGQPSWYCNTGTWIAVFTHDVLLPRERVQYTFLRVRGEQTELLQWSPGRGEPMPVVLLDENQMPA